MEGGKRKSGERGQRKKNREKAEEASKKAKENSDTMDLYFNEPIIQYYGTLLFQVILTAEGKGSKSIELKKWKSLSSVSTKKGNNFSFSFILLTFQNFHKIKLLRWHHIMVTHVGCFVHTSLIFTQESNTASSVWYVTYHHLFVTKYKSFVLLKALPPKGTFSHKKYN